MHPTKARHLSVVLAVGAAAALALSGCSSSNGTKASSATPSGTPTPTVTTSGTTPVPSTSSSPTPTAAAATGPTGGAVPKGFVPTSATFVNTDLGWALGTAPCSKDPCTSVVRTRDGGRTWRGVPAPRATLGDPNSGRDGEVASLRFADQNDGWAGVGHLYSTHDGGATWHAQTVGPKGSVISAIAVAGDWVYAATNGCPSMGSSTCSLTTSVYASPVGRDSWTKVSGTYPGSGRGLVAQGDSYYLPATDGVYIGDHTGQPTQRSNPCPTEQGSRAAPEMAAADAEHLDAMCIGGGAAGSASYQLYGSSDGGAHWAAGGKAHREPSGGFGIADNGKGVLLVAVASGTSSLLRTTDAGVTFHPAAASTPGGGLQWDDLGFTSQTRALAVLHRSGLYLSDDAGAHFRRVTF